MVMSKYRSSDNIRPQLTVAFDASCLATDKKTGVANYTERLIKELAAQHPEIKFVGHYCNFLNRKQFILPAGPNIVYRPSTYLSTRLLNMLRRVHIWLPFEFLIKQRADLHLFPAFIGWPSLYKTPAITVIHDVAYLDVPESVSALNRADLMQFVPKTLHLSRYIFTVSEATAMRLRDVYGTAVPPAVITPIPPPPPENVRTKEASAILARYGIRPKFILFVGTLEPRKNIIGVLEAYIRLPANLRETHTLVLAGAMGWNSDKIENRIKELQQQQYNIVATGYVTNADKAALYKKAAILLLPSFYEGFGMPILEAMAYGTPCVVSDIPVFHEVAKNGALFCNPYDPQDVARQLTKVLQDSAIHAEYAQRGKQNAHGYTTWERVANTAYRAMLHATKK